ncbi:hypothetical protein DIPPA_25110 [Diplonema papillatum]|nr:hypothetical protein DIPPA_15404 [Diplonema papillatum]KAJ9437474.1 hypothetical protein DIPPA_25110 [Diplonema papillatum]
MGAEPTEAGGIGIGNGSGCSAKARAAGGGARCRKTGGATAPGRSSSMASKHRLWVILISAVHLSLAAALTTEFGRAAGGGARCRKTGGATAPGRSSSMASKHRLWVILISAVHLSLAAALTTEFGRAAGGGARCRKTGGATVPVRSSSMASKHRLWVILISAVHLSLAAALTTEFGRAAGGGARCRKTGGATAPVRSSSMASKHCLWAVLISAVHLSLAAALTTKGGRPGAGPGAGRQAAPRRPSVSSMASKHRLWAVRISAVHLSLAATLLAVDGPQGFAVLFVQPQERVVDCLGHLQGVHGVGVHDGEPTEAGGIGIGNGSGCSAKARAAGGGARCRKTGGATVPVRSSSMASKHRLWAVRISAVHLSLAATLLATCAWLTARRASLCSSCSRTSVSSIPGRLVFTPEPFPPVHSRVRCLALP